MQLFARDADGWSGRAAPSDKERADRVLGAVHAATMARTAQDEHASFVNSTLEKARRSNSGATASASGRGVLAGNGTVVVQPGKPTWTYTATRAAASKPETQATLAALKAQAEALAAARAAEALAMEATLSPGRPGSAPGTHDAAVGAVPAVNRDRELSLFDVAAGRRRAISASVLTPPEGSPDATTAGATAGTNTSAYSSPYNSNYTDSYCLRSLYPEAYDTALRDTAVEPAPNYTVISAWGDSLRCGAAEAAKLYTNTTYTRVNNEVGSWRAG
jgi:hypothetical protein